MLSSLKQISMAGCLTVVASRSWLVWIHHIATLLKLQAMPSHPIHYYCIAQFNALEGAIALQGKCKTNALGISLLVTVKKSGCHALRTVKSETHL